MKKHLLTVATLLVSACAAWAQPNTPVQLKHLGSYNTGVFDDGAAEISAHDPYGQRVYFTNSALDQIQVLDISNPFTPTLIDSIDISSYGGGINSLIVFDGYVAGAIENDIKQLDGTVVFFDTAGTFINQVTVGALPDMLTISPDGTKIVVANEGEPNDDYDVDPNGSVSIIDLTPGIAALTNANVTTLDFSGFESYRQSFESSAIDNWNFTTTPAVYNTEGDSAVNGSDDVWAVISEFTGDIDNAYHGDLFWGMQDLENGNGGGAFFHTLDFDPIDISAFDTAYLSFNYSVRGFDSSDSLGYIVAFDNGMLWDMQNYVALEKDSSTWITVKVGVPAGSNFVRLRLMGKQNGSSDYAAFDNVKLSFLDGSTRVFGNDDFSTVAADLEPEYISVDANSAFAYVALQENNAYAKVDLNTAEILEVKGFGFKNHMAPGNGFDASNTAPGINITNWPVYGIYQPDAIACYSYAGSSFIVTANEGDARDYDGYSEEDRVKDLVLDSTVFPNYALLQENDELGRLKITTSMGDIDQDGEYEEIYAYGGRSFSIFDEQGNLVYDSGDDFEQITSAAFPLQFNSTNDDNDSFKNRSDDKGPEPEGVVVGYINGRNYAFIGLERMGGIMVYDVTDPNAVTFVQYLNNRDFSQPEDSTSALDLAPEGLVFIPKAESPNGRDMLVVSNEVSGTVSLYQIDINNTIDGDVALETFTLDNPGMIGVYGDTIYEGGISGLYVKPNTENEFYLITDRGPNMVANNHPLATGTTKLFPFPDYAPKVMEVTATAGEMTINQIDSLKRPGGTAASGLPLPLGAGATGEVAWSDTSANVVGPDAWGIDSEGILEGKDGDFWVCDEYGASVWHLNSNYEVIERYTPFANLPEDVMVDTMIGERRPNRGFEGVAIAPNGKIYAILQSPVFNPNSAASHASRIHRILEIDPATGAMQQFAYEHREPIGAIRNRDWKIGDLVAVNNDEFLLIEHAERQGWNYKDVFMIDISAATPITVEDFGGMTLEELGDAATLQANGIETVAKTHVFDLLENGWDLSHDKPEGITIINDSTFAVINDNDYGIDSPNDDGAIVFTGKTTQLYIYDLPFTMNYVSPYCNFDLAADTTVCEGEAVAFAGVAGYESYLWNIGDTTQAISAEVSGAYSLVSTTVDGCVGRDTVNLNTNILPVVDLGVDTSLCLNAAITMDAGNNFNAYAWSTGGTMSTEGYTAATVGTDTVIVLVTDSNGCVGTDSVQVMALALPVVDLGPDAEVCAEDDLDLDAGAGFNAYAWSTGGTDQEENYEGITTGVEVVSVEVTDASGCVGTDSVSITTLALPTVSITGPDTICLSGEATFDAGSGFADYDWSTGGNGQSEMVDGSQLGVGTSNVIVTVSDANGCENDADFEIYVDACASIEENQLAAVAVFPNPATNVLHVSFETGALDQVMLYNAVGAQVKQVAVAADASQITLDLYDQPSGVYYLNVVQGKQVHTVKVIKL